ncbi:MAG: hypothetical protein K0B52_01740, partial [FCB group bacterium]|nr:hypothetical protein [FCB group bacterium]
MNRFLTAFEMTTWGRGAMGSEHWARDLREDKKMGRKTSFSTRLIFPEYSLSIVNCQLHYMICISY